MPRLLNILYQCQNVFIIVKILSQVNTNFKDPHYIASLLLIFSVSSLHVYHVAAAPVSNVIVHNESVTSSSCILTWMEISLTSSNFRHYTVFYLPVSGPYGPIMASNRRKRQSAQAGELTMNFTGTTGTLTNLYGAVTYRIQVAAVGTFNGQEVIGDQSAATEMTTLEGSKQLLLPHILYQYCVTLAPTAPRDLNYTDLLISDDMFNITLIWSRPDPPNGIILHYNVSDIINNNYLHIMMCFIGVL